MSLTFDELVRKLECLMLDPESLSLEEQVHLLTYMSILDKSITFKEYQDFDGKPLREVFEFLKQKNDLKHYI